MAFGRAILLQLPGCQSGAIAIYIYPPSAERRAMLVLLSFAGYRVVISDNYSKYRVKNGLYFQKRTFNYEHGT